MTRARMIKQEVCVCTKVCVCVPSERFDALFFDLLVEKQLITVEHI